MAKHKYFELDEFITSCTAKKKRIDNTPTFEVVDHLNELVEYFLDPLRAAYGAAIWVRSGFRCLELNKLLGGSDTSVHPLGYAADLTVDGDFQAFCDFVVDWVKKYKIKFDQILIESDKKTGARWLHVGLKNRLGQQRGQIKVMEV